MPVPVVTNRSALITGCSTGIGRAAARLLKARGWRVWASARKADDLRSLAEEGFEPLELDVADETSVASAVERVLSATQGRLGALVNNAGFGLPGPVEDLSRDALRRQFEVNVFGLQDLTNRVLPAMIEAGEGRIVHVSSVLGRVSIPLMGVYCASKHAVEALADAQRVELRGTGVWVALVEPGPIATAFHQNARAAAEAALTRGSRRFDLVKYAELSQKPPPFTLPPEAAARAIIHAVESPRPKTRYRVTVQAHVAPALRQLLPESWLDYLLDRRIREIRR